jgi:Spy/CpxP family protein refolding chaperone
MMKKKALMSLEEAKSVLGKYYGSQGGKARAVKLTPEQRQAIAKLGGQAKWKDHVPKSPPTRPTT